MNIGRYIELYSEDLKFRNYSSNTIENYKSQVAAFLYYFNNVATKPSEISEKQIKDWLMLSNSINGRKHRISAVKLFYKLTGKQPLKFKHIPYPRSEKKLPQIIEKQFLLDRIYKIQNKKHKAIIALAYSTGMRVSEVCNLKQNDIDSKRMIITVRQSKGRKDRVVALSQYVLDLLREYHREYRPKEYVFNGQFDLKYSAKSCNELVKKYIGKKYHMHTLRHSTATDLYEKNVDLKIIGDLLGHKSRKTTEIYCHTSTKMLNKLPLAM